MPALPLLLFTCRNASFRLARSQMSSMIRRVLAGRSGSHTAEGDSMSSRPPCRASPLGADEKSSLIWRFSRLSPSRFMSYWPLLSFGPSVTRSRRGLSVSPPFGLECLTSLADGMTHYALCWLRSECLTAPPVAEATQSRSPGVSSAAFCAQSPNLRSAPLMDMDFTVRCPFVRCSRLVFGFCPSTRAFAWCFLQTPPCGESPCTLLALHLHQVGRRTFTSELLSMPGTQRDPPVQGHQERCCGGVHQRRVRLRNGLVGVRPGLPCLCLARGHGRLLRRDVRSNGQLRLSHVVAGHRQQRFRKNDRGSPGHPEESVGSVTGSGAAPRRGADAG